MDKSFYRNYAKNIRKNIDISSLSCTLADKIRILDIYKSARNVMIFYPTKYEVDLRILLNEDKNFFLPKVSGEELLVCPYSDDLYKSELNIMEPKTLPVEPQILDLVIVPALMTDNDNYRLGYGGGYYDRFLKTINAKTLVAIPKELIVESLPHDQFDVPVDYVVEA